MNVLQQVAARVGIQFVGSGEPVECGAESVHYLFIQRILAGDANRGGLHLSHIQGSRSKLSFLTGKFQRCWVHYINWLAGGVGGNLIENVRKLKLVFFSRDVAYVRRQHGISDT